MKKIRIYDTVRKKIIFLFCHIDLPFWEFYNSGLANGTNGSRNLAYPRETYPGVWVTKEDIEYLDKVGVKYNEEDVIFVIHNEFGYPIWLEEGNLQRGYAHICKISSNGSSHAKELANYLLVKESDVPKAIHDVIKDGKIIERRTNNRDPSIIYEYKNKKILVVFGTNGYIVTAFPFDN